MKRLCMCDGCVYLRKHEKDIKKDLSDLEEGLIRLGDKIESFRKSL